MKRKVLVAFVAAAALVLGACGGSSISSSTLGPSYGKFTVAFPSTPTSASNTKEVLSGFPSGVTGATAYWVSPVADPLSSTSKTPPAPSYLVVVGHASSASEAAAFTSSIKQVAGAKPVTVDGATGYTFSGTEKNLNQGGATNPSATEAFMYLSKGTTLYALIVIANSASEAQQFLNSFKPQ